MAPTALERAYSYINRRERTEAELRAHLAQHEVTSTEAEAVMAELREHGYVDDARYARLFAQDRRELDGWGSERIRRALTQRGIDRELATEAASTEQDTELERALELLRRRFPAPPRERRERDRALGVLLRKGYGSELALDALASFANHG